MERYLKTRDLFSSLQILHNFFSPSSTITLRNNSSLSLVLTDFLWKLRGIITITRIDH